MLELKTMRSPLGVLRLVARDHALIGVYLPVQPLPLPPPPEGRSPVLALAAAQLAAYFAGELRTFELPLAPAGTEFQREVWGQLAQIPYAATTSYGAIARALG